jgi:hypothetical protein
MFFGRKNGRELAPKSCGLNKSGDNCWRFWRSMQTFTCINRLRFIALLKESTLD